MVEVHWVLVRAYKISKEECAQIIGGLLESRELRLGQDEVVRAALAMQGHGIDFADAVIAELGRVTGCDHTVTFDKRAARSGMMKELAANQHVS